MTATLSGAGILSFGGGTDLYIPNSAITLTDAANLTLNGDAVDNVTDFPLGRGDGTTTTLTLHPSITTLTTLYRTDWQGKQRIYSTSRTNLLLYSEQFGNEWWTKAWGYTVDNVAIAPDGTATADRLAEDTTASTTHWVRRILSFTAGTRYTTSVYAKAGERTAVWVRAGAGSAFFNLATGTLVTTLGTGATGGIDAIPNGWYRCWCSCVAPTTGSEYVGFGLMNGTAPANSAYTGDGGSGAFFWGAQLETGTATPTSYIPTTSAPVTVTDYSVSGSTVTFTETPVYNAEFSMDGTVTGLPFLWAKP